MCTMDKVFAAIALAVNNGPCEIHPMGGGSEGEKRFLMDEMEQAVGEEGVALRGGMYMLLALILELWRRNEYVFAALSANLDDHDFSTVDPTYAARISLHNQGLHAFEKKEIGETDWKARAEMANAIVHRMLLITEEPHQQFLSAAAEGVSRPAVLEEENHHVPGLKDLIASTEDEPHVAGGAGGHPGDGRDEVAGDGPSHGHDENGDGSQDPMAVQPSIARPVEPAFSELLRTALRMGWTLVPYDTNPVAPSVR